MAVFWVVAPCGLVEVYQRFRGPCCPLHQGALMMEAARISETVVNFYQAARRYNPEDSHLLTSGRLSLFSKCFQYHWFDRMKKCNNTVCSSFLRKRRIFRKCNVSRQGEVGLLFAISPRKVALGSTGARLWSYPLTPSGAEVKNAWSYTSTPPYVFTTWFLIKHRDNFCLQWFQHGVSANFRNESNS
jgi:hypothetical protein